jgi:hypothetical protein
MWTPQYHPCVSLATCLWPGVLLPKSERSKSRQCAATYGSDGRSSWLVPSACVTAAPRLVVAFSSPRSASPPRWVGMHGGFNLGEQTNFHDEKFRRNSQQLCDHGSSEPVRHNAVRAMSYGTRFKQEHVTGFHRIGMISRDMNGLRHYAPSATGSNPTLKSSL